MNESELRIRLSLVEAQLFASTELAVIAAIDASPTVEDAVIRLQELGMTQAEAGAVLQMPLAVRTKAERDLLFAKAAELRSQLDTEPDGSPD